MCLAMMLWTRIVDEAMLAVAAARARRKPVAKRSRGGDLVAEGITETETTVKLFFLLSFARALLLLVHE